MTGATGFLGSALLKELIRSGYKVTIIKRSTSDLSRIGSFIDKTNFYNIDLYSLSDIFEQQSFDVVIHLAASYKDIDAFEVNFLLSKKLLDLAIKYKVKRFINTDTFYSYVYGKDYNKAKYLISKKHFAEWLKIESNKIEVINLILGHLYGPFDNKDKFVPWLYDSLKSKKQIDFTEGEQKRDFIYIRDVVKAYKEALALNSEMISDAIDAYVGSNYFVSLKYFINKFLQIMYSDLPDYKSPRINFGGLQYREGEIITPKKIKYDIKMPSELNYSLERGIKELIYFEN